MRLRNIVHLEEKSITHEQIMNYMEQINKGDTIVSCVKSRVEKVPIDLKELLLENMKLIEKLIEVENK